MLITWQTIVTLAAVLGAIFAVMKYYNQGYEFVRRQKEQDKEIQTIKDEIKDVKEEQSLICYGVLACLKGLSKQGIDGPVSDAIDKFEEHLNKKAHEVRNG